MLIHKQRIGKKSGSHNTAINIFTFVKKHFKADERLKIVGFW